MTDTTPTAPLSLAEEIRQIVSGMSGVHRLGTPVSRLATAVLRDADRADGVRVAEAPDAPAGTAARHAATPAPSSPAPQTTGGSVIVEVALVAEYLARIDALCEAVREKVGGIVLAHGREVAGVDVDVVDVHGPFDPLPGEEPTARAAAAVRGAAASVADGARSAATTVADGAKELSATVRDQAGEIAETARDRAGEIAETVRDRANGVTAAVRDRGADATTPVSPEASEADDATARISRAAAMAAAAEARAIAEESGADRAEVDVEIHVDAIAGPDAEGDAQAIAEATPAHADDARAEEHSDGARVTVEDDAETGAAETREGER